MGDMPVKNLFKALRKRILFELSRQNNPFFIGYYRYFYRPGKNTLAYYLDILSRSTNDFFVLQIGANDGMTHDPIHKFIKRDRWKGVLMEPQTMVFQEELYPLYDHQPGIEVVNAALGDQDGEATLYCIGFSEARWATGLASFDRSVLDKSFASGHVERQAKKEGIDVPVNANERIAEVKVPVLSVETIIDKYQVQKIDLLQIDTEGYDFEIIRLFDLTKIRPRVISYENMHLSRMDQEACCRHLKSNNYQVKHFGGNTLAADEDLFRN